MSHVFEFEKIKCPDGCECPIVQLLNERLKEISQRIEEVEKLRRKRLFSPKEQFTAKNIHHIRNKHGLTQQDLAHILGVNVATINRREREKSIPSDKMQKKLHNLKKLGVRQTKLLLAQKVPCSLSGFSRKKICTCR